MSNCESRADESPAENLIDLFCGAYLRKSIIVAASILFMFCSLGLLIAQAQESAGTSSHAGVLPNSPEPAQVSDRPGEDSLPRAQTANIAGTVLDTNGDVVQGATVTLFKLGGSAPRSVVSGGNGQFALSGLSAGVYTVTVAARGMSKFRSTPIALQEGEVHTLPPVTLAVSGATTSVTVNGDNEELSEEQVQIAVQQRVAGIFPNFYSSYDWDAPPMEAKQKFQLSFHSMFDPVEFAAVGAVAGAEQYENVFPEYGGGIGGYGKRYGAELANHVSSDLLSDAVFPSIFHQDPRYFYKGTGSFRSRALYAMSAAVIARGDNGRWETNYSKLLGNFSAAAISNLYYPASNRGVSLVVFNGLANTGADAVGDLVREFVLKRFTRRISNGPSGQQ